MITPRLTTCSAPFLLAAGSRSKARLFDSRNDPVKCGIFLCCKHIIPGVVAMSVPRERITYQDYLQLPEDSRYEVLEGDLRMVPAPGELHQRVLARVYQAVSSHVERYGLGRVYFAPVDVILDEDSVVQPDLLVILTAHLSILKPEGVRGAPDLVVEVLSLGTATRDRGIKRRLYGRYGVQEYWMVDPHGRTVEVAVLRDGSMQTWNLFAEGRRVESPLLSGLGLLVDDLLAE